MIKYHCKVDYAYPDNEESVHIRSLDNRCENEGFNIIVRGSKKEPINDRIECSLIMIAFNVLQYIKDECDSWVQAMTTAMWNSKKQEDERLDDFTTDIDSLDAFEYSFERDMKRINDAIRRN